MSVVVEHKVTIKVHADTPFRVKDKIALLDNVSRLEIEDQQRILKICKNPKALQAIAFHWTMLESMFS